MKKFVLINFLLLAILSATSGFGQKKDRQDLSGTWELARSTVNSPLLGYEPEKPSEDNNKKITWKFVIEHSDPVIKVTQIRITETTAPGTKETAKSEESFPVQTFYTDGRGETNVNKNNISYSSITQWDGKGLRTKLIGKPIAGTKFWESAQTIWGLFDNDKELRIVIMSSKTQDFFGADQHIINTDPFGRTDFYKRESK
jgi:hypothetical protein